MGNDDDHEGQRELAAALKHDLGKYVAWRSANLQDADWAAPLSASAIEALRSDVLSTRSGPGVDEAAWSIFARHTAAWRGAWPAELVAVERALAVLRGHEVALRAGDPVALAPAVAELRAAQLAIRTELAALVRRLAHKE